MQRQVRSEAQNIDLVNAVDVIDEASSCAPLVRSLSRSATMEGFFCSHLLCCDFLGSQDQLYKLENAGYL